MRCILAITAVWVGTVSAYGDEAYLSTANVLGACIEAEY
jgi:hypothetical protein